MDANEQRPTAEQPQATGPAETRRTSTGPTDPGSAATCPSDQSPSQAGSTPAEREAASRANHPSRWQPREARSPRPEAAAAAHYERAAVRWLTSQDGHFGAWPERDEDRAAALGALGDIALLVGLRLQREPGDLTDDYRKLLSTLTEVAARADTRAMLQHDPRALLPLVALHGSLRSAWLEDAALGQALDRALGLRSVVGLARTPAEQIALHHLLARAGLDLPCPQLSALLATSLIADDIAGLPLDAGQIHEVGAIVAMSTDFGAAAVQWPANVTAGGMAGALQEWLVLGMADEDPGLVGELLIAAGCLDPAGSALVDAARRWLRGWQESDGRVEGSLAAAAGDLELDATAWAARVHATTMTAVDGLLMRTAPEATPLNRPAAAADAPDVELIESIMAAADWLDAVLPATHVQGRLWTSEAWLALGDEDEARRQLLGLCDDPHIAFTVLKESGDQAVHLAALVVALGITSDPLADLCGDVAALLTHPEAADELLGPARARARLMREEDAIPLAVDAAGLQRPSRELCAHLLRDGAHTDPRSHDGLDELLLLARAARAAARAGDLSWLALLLRGLHRMRLAPARLVTDVARILRSQQRADGALCDRPPGAPAGVGDRQVRWTLEVLTALVEELPPARLPDAA